MVLVKSTYNVLAFQEVLIDLAAKLCNFIPDYLAFCCHAHVAACGRKAPRRASSTAHANRNSSRSHLARKRFVVGSVLRFALHFLWVGISIYLFTVEP